MLSTYKSSTRTMHREEGMRLYRHLLDMLTEVERLRTGGSNPSSRPGLHTDALIQVSKLAVRHAYRIVYHNLGPTVRTDPTQID
jgi:hypothetical protein